MACMQASSTQMYQIWCPVCCRHRTSIKGKGKKLALASHCLALGIEMLALLKRCWDAGLVEVRFHPLAQLWRKRAVCFLCMHARHMPWRSQARWAGKRWAAGPAVAVGAPLQAF